ncbi:MAG: TraR/DksA C4-type zinc finger protein [Ferruginibacter sp.]
MAIQKKAAKQELKKSTVKKSVPGKATAVTKAKKPVPAKKVAASKKPVAPVKATPKKATPSTKIQVKKPAAKKIALPVKSVPVKTQLPKNAKPTTPATKKPEAVQKPALTPMPKKVEVKKPSPIKEEIKKVVSPKATAKNVKDIKVLPPKAVVLPRINTKTSRTYQPDFTKSVLDQPKHNPGEPIVRYNDADLMEFRELIGRKMESAKKELNYLQGLITRKDEMGGDESDNRYMTMEDGSLSMEREQLSQMASRQITFVDHLEKALMRIENKTYGICRVTGKLIDKARLRAVPHATLCIEAKMGIVK